MRLPSNTTEHGSLSSSLLLLLSVLLLFLLLLLMPCRCDVDLMAEIRNAPRSADIDCRFRLYFFLDLKINYYIAFIWNYML